MRKLLNLIESEHEYFNDQLRMDAAVAFIQKKYGPTQIDLPENEDFVSALMAEFENLNLPQETLYKISDTGEMPDSIDIKDAEEHYLNSWQGAALMRIFNRHFDHIDIRNDEHIAQINKIKDYLTPFQNNIKVLQFVARTGHLPKRK